MLTVYAYGDQWHIRCHIEKMDNQSLNIPFLVVVDNFTSYNQNIIRIQGVLFPSKIKRMFKSDTRVIE